LINATVLDSHDRPVRGLDRDDFRLFEGKAEQTIGYFSEEETPLSLVVVLDTSGSMEANLSAARRALAAVLKTSNRDDEFSLITFSEHPGVTVDWTSDEAEIQSRGLLTRSSGCTSLLDAIHLGIGQIRHSHNPRRALLILSDGGDNNSRFTEREIVSQLEEADVQMYAIDMLGSPFLHDRTPEEAAGPDLLDRLCGRVGGRYFQVMDDRQLQTIADRIAKELRSQYVLGYVPASGAVDGRFHHVQLKVQRPAAGTKLSVYWRRGYRAPQQ
jgi:Ca-activated chloride channel family protein